MDPRLHLKRLRVVFETGFQKSVTHILFKALSTAAGHTNRHSLYSRRTVGNPNRTKVRWVTILRPFLEAEANVAKFNLKWHITREEARASPLPSTDRRRMHILFLALVDRSRTDELSGTSSITAAYEPADHSLKAHTRASSTKERH